MTTLGQILKYRVEHSGDNNSVGWIENNQIKFITFNEYYNQIKCISNGLMSIGMNPGVSVSILSNTRKEWHLVDMAILCGRGITIPIYHTYTDDEVAYIFNHSESQIFFVEDEEQFDKVIECQNKLKNLKTLVLFDRIPFEKLDKLDSSINHMNFDELLLKGRQHSDQNQFEKAIESQTQDEIASIIYTSGTTGEPKGAVITQLAITIMIENTRSSVGSIFSEDDRTLTWLPLSHVFGRCESLFCVSFGWEMVFARSLDKLITDLALVRPTILLAVPRIFEKIYAKIMEQLEDGSFIKRGIFNWAKEVSDVYYEKLQDDISPTTHEILLQKLAYKIVFSKIYQKFGGRVRYFVSGGAPISPEIIKFLRNANLTIIEGYGLTETVAPCMLNPPSKQIPGTVGVPLGEVEIDLAEDGEIMVKSKALFKEYYKRPEETANSFKGDWFLTGDIGEWTPEGYLKITDRKKDIIITSGGKNVAPQKIENLLKLQKYIAHAVICGDRQKYLTGIIGIEKEPFMGHLEEMGLSENCTLEEISKNPLTHKLINQNVSSINKDLASFETVKKIHISSQEFSVENGFITPSLKVRKKNVISHFKTEIDEMYQQ